MKWTDFIAQIKEAGFDGDGDNFDVVVKWLKKERFDPDEVKTDDETYNLRELFDARPGKKLDVTAAATKAAEEARINDLVNQRMEEINEETGRNKGNKAHKHINVKVGADRLVEDPKGGFKSFGDFANSVHGAHTRAGVSPELAAWQKALSTYSLEGVGADGGYAVPPEWRAEIEKVVFGEDSLLSRCTQFPLAGNSITLPLDVTTPWQTSGGVLAYWEGEAGAKTQSKVALNTVDLRLRKCTVLCPVTDELLEDAIALGAFLNMTVGEKMDFKIGEAIIRGTGAGQPLGILNSGSIISVDKETDQAADTICYSNVLKMWQRLYAPYRSDAVWLINQDCEEQLHSMCNLCKTCAGTAVCGGGAVYVPAGGPNAMKWGMLFGRPVIPTQHCETVGDTGDIILASFKQYITAVKSGGLQSATSIHLWFDQDVTAFRFVMRVDGQPKLLSAISPRDGSNTMSAFVKLDARG